MQKVDSSILGFNVTSNERINVGEREYVEWDAHIHVLN